MMCKCGKECSGAAFAPKRQDWEYETPRSPYLLHEVCEHGTVTVDNRPKGSIVFGQVNQATGGVLELTNPAAPIGAGPQPWKERKR